MANITVTVELDTCADDDFVLDLRDTLVKVSENATAFFPGNSIVRSDVICHSSTLMPKPCDITTCEKCGTEIVIGEDCPNYGFGEFHA